MKIMIKTMEKETTAKGKYVVTIDDNPKLHPAREVVFNHWGEAFYEIVKSLVEWAARTPRDNEKYCVCPSKWPQNEWIHDVLIDGECAKCGKTRSRE